jgi:hypothetical protein
MSSQKMTYKQDFFSADHDDNPIPVAGICD